MSFYLRLQRIRPICVLVGRYSEAVYRQNSDYAKSSNSSVLNCTVSSELALKERGNSSNDLAVFSASESGFSLSELLVVMLMLAILSATVIPNLKSIDNPLQNASEATRGFMKQVRAKAIAKTGAYLVQPVSATELQVLSGPSCSTATSVDPSLRLQLPNNVILNDTTWDICFNSRGFADNNVEIVMQDKELATRLVEVYLGGSVEVR